MSVDIKAAATGIVALCLALAALLYIMSGTGPSMEDIADRFFGLAVVLILIVVILAVVGIKIKFP